MTTYEQLKWLYENHGESIKIEPWYSSKAHRYLWIGKDKEGEYSAWLATGKTSHCRAGGVLCYMVTFNAQGETPSIMQSHITMWPAKEEEKEKIKQRFAEIIKKTYDRLKNRS